MKKNEDILPIVTKNTMFLNEWAAIRGKREVLNPSDYISTGPINESATQMMPVSNHNKS